MENTRKQSFSDGYDVGWVNWRVFLVLEKEAITRMAGDLTSLRRLTRSDYLARDLTECCPQNARSVDSGVAQ